MCKNNHSFHLKAKVWISKLIHNRAHNRQNQQVDSLIILSPYSEYRYRNWLKTLGDVILSLIVVIPDINHLVLQFLKFKSRKISNQLPINLVLSKTIDATSDGRLGKIRYLIGSAILD
jgi:hypothetical protein